MSIYYNVTEQDLIILPNLPEQEKNERAFKIKNRILKQTHHINLAESLSPITKKLDEVKDITHKIGDVIKATVQPAENIKPISQNSQSQTHKLISAGNELVKTFSKLNDSKNFFKVIRDAEGKLSWNSKQITPLGG